MRLRAGTHQERPDPTRPAGKRAREEAALWRPGRPGQNTALLAIFAFIGLVPVLRMILLHNHAFLHCFFTCRAFMATVMAAVLILEELTKERGKADGPGRKRA